MYNVTMRCETPEGRAFNHKTWNINKTCPVEACNAARELFFREVGPGYRVLETKAETRQQEFERECKKLYAKGSGWTGD